MTWTDFRARRSLLFALTLVALGPARAATAQETVPEPPPAEPAPQPAPQTTPQPAPQPAPQDVPPPPPGQQLGAPTAQPPPMQPAPVAPPMLDIDAELHYAEQLHLEGDDVRALDRLEALVASGNPLLYERETLRRTARAIRSLTATGAEPGWFYVGLPALGAGGLGTIITLLTHALSNVCFGGLSCSRVDDTGFHIGYAAAASVGVTGLVFILLGLINHTWDGERRDFDHRRDDVRRMLLEGRRAAQVRF